MGVVERAICRLDPYRKLLDPEGNLFDPDSLGSFRQSVYLICHQLCDFKRRGGSGVDRLLKSRWP